MIPDEDGLPGAAALIALAVFLLAIAALLHHHDTCLDRAAGNPVAIEQCRDMQ